MSIRTEARGGGIECGRSWGCTALNDTLVSRESEWFDRSMARNDRWGLVPAFRGRDGAPNAIRAIDLEGDFWKIVGFLAWLRFTSIADFSSLDASLDEIFLLFVVEGSQGLVVEHDVVREIFVVIGHRGGFKKYLLYLIT